MKKIALVFVIISLGIFVFACSDGGTDPNNNSFNYPLAEGNWWEYDAYEIDGTGEKTGEPMSNHTITLGAMTELDGKTAYKLNSDNSNEENKDIFTHIGTDDEGIYMYIDELDLNAFESFPVSEVKIPILIPGWIKVFDYIEDNWESFFVDINQVMGQDTIKGKVQITGEKQSNNSVDYLGKNYNAQVVNMEFDISAKIGTPDISVDQSAVSNIRFEFIDGVGIYSIRQGSNGLIGIGSAYIDVLKSNGKK